DLVFDVRFLQNPFYEPDLRPRTGQDEDVAAFIAKDPAWPEFRDALQGLLATLLPHYKREGKSYLTIAFGCTGGRHRSVFATETAARMLIGEGHRVTLRHRDVENTAD
ncbi:RNase adaptor protein RapZ, partial [bacterium]|nr:RNase adaptor protein RapZ [bacterium]